MRQGDVIVGEEYAHRSSAGYQRFGADRVRVVTPPAGGKAEVEFLDLAPGPRWETKPRKGSRSVVQIRNLLCPWHAWPAMEAKEREAQARQAAEAEAWRAEHDAEKLPQPERLVPNEYNSWARWRDDDDDAYVSDLVESIEAVSRRANVMGDVRAAFTTLGLRSLARDLTAAALHVASSDDPWSERHRLENMDGSQLEADPRVALSFGRAAALLAHTAYEKHGAASARVRLAFAPYDEEFLSACDSHVAEKGGRLGLPFVPSLPEWLLADAAPAPGWARLSYGETSGDRLHAPDCHVLKSNRRDYDVAPTMPAWHLTVGEWSVCGVCDGPRPRITPELIAFRAASDVWRARGAQAVEDWQVRAALQYAALSDLTRARDGEPGVTLATRVWSTFVDGRPSGEEGWAQYHSLSLRPPPASDPSKRVIDPTTARRALQRVMALVEFVGFIQLALTSRRRYRIVRAQGCKTCLVSWTEPRRGHAVYRLAEHTPSQTR